VRDTYREALVLIGVSVAVVFAVLWVLFLLIRFMRSVFDKLELRDPERGSTEKDKHMMILTGAQSEDSSQEEDLDLDPVIGTESSDDSSREEMRFMSSGVDALTQAAVMAALAAYMSSETVSSKPMFLRGIKGSGAWGRMSRTNAYRGSGSYIRHLGSKGGCGSCVDLK